MKLKASKTISNKSLLQNPMESAEQKVLNELFKNWVDELLHDRILRFQLSEYFFTTDLQADETEILMTDLERTILKKLDEKNKDLCPIVTETIRGMKMLVDEKNLFGYVELADRLRTEKEKYADILENISKDVCIDRFLSKLDDPESLKLLKLKKGNNFNLPNDQLDLNTSS